MSNLQVQARSLHHNAGCPLLPMVVRMSRTEKVETPGLRSQDEYALLQDGARWFETLAGCRLLRSRGRRVRKSRT